MKKKLKELIENSSVKTVGNYEQILIISNGIYKGLWGINGYNNILILGKEGDNWFIVSESPEVDVLDLSILLRSHCKIDIPTDYNCVRMIFDRPIRIDTRFKWSSVEGKI